jgi:hypothetical protein
VELLNFKLNLSKFENSLEDKESMGLTAYIANSWVGISDTVDLSV